MSIEETRTATDSSSGGERQIVAFSLGQETYGVDIASVREIIPIQKIVPVPRAPDFVEGIINLRGRIVRSSTSASSSGSKRKGRPEPAYRAG